MSYIYIQVPTQGVLAIPALCLTKTKDPFDYWDNNFDPPAAGAEIEPALEDCVMDEAATPTPGAKTSSSLSPPEPSPAASVIESEAYSMSFDQVNHKGADFLAKKTQEPDR